MRSKANKHARLERADASLMIDDDRPAKSKNADVATQHWQVSISVLTMWTFSRSSVKL
jgi:hypothetical protein